MFVLPVLLADKEIESILRPQEVVIVQDFHGAHPVRVEVTCNLQIKYRRLGQHSRPCLQICSVDASNTIFVLELQL